MRATNVGVLLVDDLDPAEVRRRVRRGEWTRLRRRVVAVRPPRTELEALAQRVWAALLVLPPGTAACGPTAARLWRLPSVLPDDGVLHLLLPSGARHDGITGCRLRERVGGAVVTVNDVPCTPLARTSVDEAARLPLGPAVAILDAALQHEPGLRSELARALVEMPSRGRRAARAAVELATGVCESPLESLAWVLWHAGGLPPPEVQAVIKDGSRFVARVDFLWRARKVVVEVDGRAKYDEPGEWQREKERQNKLVAMGYIVLRFTWRDVVGRSEYVLACVRRAVG